MVTLGIDPGLAGFLILLDGSGQIMSGWKMPLDARRKFDPVALWRVFKEIEEIAAGEFQSVQVALEGLLSLPSDTNKITKLVAEIEKAPTPELFDEVRRELKKTDGRVGTGTMFKNWGMIAGMITAIGWRYIVPSPRTWQKVIHECTSGKQSAKLRTYEAVKALWPNEDWNEGKRRGFNDGKCDAAAIAEYGRRELK